MKAIDMAAAMLLVLGGLSWGLIGVYGLDPVAALLGESTDASRSFYALVGAAAFYQAASLVVIRRRWNVAPLREKGVGRDRS